MKITDDYLKDAREVIIKVFDDVRPTLLDNFGKIEHELKKDKSVVTKLDLEVEAKIRQALTKFDKGVGLWGEEHGREGNEDTFWLIDPIDGTESFIRGIPNPRNMVTLVDNGELIMTFVYKFVTDELFEATKNKGAYLNDTKISVSKRPIERAWIDISVHLNDPNANKALQEVRKHINGYTIMRDFTRVALGQIDGNISWDTYGGPWDYAPRGLLFKEAGAKVVTIGSNSFDYQHGHYLAANPLIFDKLNEILVSCIPSSKTVQ